MMHSDDMAHGNLDKPLYAHPGDHQGCPGAAHHCWFEVVCALLLTTGIAGCRRGPVEGKEPVEVVCRAELLDGELVISYSVTNRTGAPIVLFDRMRDWKDEWYSAAPIASTRLDANWAYFEVVDGVLGDAAKVSRAMSVYPNIMSHPAMPFGRELAPGQTVHDRFVLHVPPDENIPWKEMTLPSSVPWNAHYEAGRVRSLAFEVGWMPAPLPPKAVKLSMSGEDVWYISYWHYESLYPQQRLAHAEALPLTFEVRRFVRKPSHRDGGPP